MRHLLTHTSGIFARGVVRWQGSPLLAVTTRQAFRQIAAARTFGPGNVGFYSDAGHFLLGMVIERASGQTYRDFMRRRVFEPLGMAHTSLTDRRRVLPGRVSTYELADGQLTLAPRADPAPERTRALSALLADVAAGRESPVMTAAHAAYFRALPPIARDPLRTQLAGLGALEFLGCDEVAGKGIRITDAIERICHYRADAGGPPTWFTF